MITHTKKSTYLVSCFWIFIWMILFCQPVISLKITKMAKNGPYFYPILSIYLSKWLNLWSHH